MERTDIRQRIEALKCAHQAIDMGQRATGRTTRELDRVCDGEAVICSVRERQLIERHFRSLGRHVSVSAPRIDEFPRGNIPRGAKDVHFTHDFVQDWIEHELSAIGMEIERRMQSLQRPGEVVRHRVLRQSIKEPCPILDDLTFTPDEGHTFEYRKNISAK